VTLTISATVAGETVQPVYEAGQRKTQCGAVTIRLIRQPHRDDQRALRIRLRRFIFVWEIQKFKNIFGKNGVGMKPKYSSACVRPSRSGRPHGRATDQD
jgi:hypothetical protein